MVAILVLAVVVAGGVAYLMRQAPPTPKAAARSKPLPKSGSSPSAYDYMMRRGGVRGKSETRSRGGAASAAGAMSLSTDPLASASIEDFVAEVIDGDRHYLIHFRRVPEIRVATEHGPGVSRTEPKVTPPPATPSGAVYLANHGWWSVTRPAANQAPKNVVASVVLDAFIAPDGTVEHAEVVSGPPDLGAAALEAVKRWHYDPPGPGAPPMRQVTVNFSVSPK